MHRRGISLLISPIRSGPVPVTSLDKPALSVFHLHWPGDNFPALLLLPFLKEEVLREIARAGVLSMSPLSEVGPVPVGNPRPLDLSDSWYGGWGWGTDCAGKSEHCSSVRKGCRMAPRPEPGRAGCGEGPQCYPPGVQLSAGVCIGRVIHKATYFKCLPGLSHCHMRLPGQGG